MSLDFDGFRANLRAMLAHPLVAIVAPGGTGEMYSLTPDEHAAVTRAAVEEASDRIPVIAGVGFNVPIAAGLARQAAAVGASGILAFPPEPILRPTMTACSRDLPEDWRGDPSLWTARLQPRLGPSGSGPPWLVSPRVSRRSWGGRTARGTSGDCRLCGRRSATGCTGSAARVTDMVPAYYSTGIRAFTSSIANIAPHLAVQLHEAAARGDAQTLQPLMDLIVPLYALRAKRRGYEVTVMKALMNLMGLAGGRVRAPLPELDAQHLTEVRTLAALWAART